MDRNRAEQLALAALQHLAGDHDLLGVFLAETGLAPGDLRAIASQPTFHGAVLDFLLQDDRRVLDFAAGHNLPPEAVAAARHALPGGAPIHWT